MLDNAMPSFRTRRALPRGFDNGIACCARGTGRNRTDDSSFADCRLTSWPRRPVVVSSCFAATLKRIASGVRSSTPLARSTRTTIGQLQQTGMLFIITQQLQPFSIIMTMQSQHSWIMAIIWGSPLV